MAIKDLAVSYNATDNADTALRLAVQMCNKYSATLTGVYVSTPVHFEGPIERWVPDSVMESFKSAEGEVAASIKSRFEEQVSNFGFKGATDWVHVTGQANDVLTGVARYYDLMLIGQFTERAGKSTRIRAEELVSRTGRPLLVVPHDYEPRDFGEHAVVAWDGSRPAARALADAMQILETKKRLDVLSIEKPGKKATRRQEGWPDIVQHLKRHDIDARRVSLSASRDGVGTTIIQYCSDTKPDILVIGAYGHSALREDLFGGVTRHIMRNMTVPVLMAH